MKISKKEQSIIISYLDTNFEQSSKKFAGIFKDNYGITTKQMSVIWRVHQLKLVNMTKLANDTSISKQELTRIVDVLVQKNCLHRVYNEKNRRIIEIELTEHGQDIITGATELFIEKFGTLLDKLSDEEHEELMNALAAVSKYLTLLD